MMAFDFVNYEKYRYGFANIHCTNNYYGSDAEIHFYIADLEPIPSTSSPINANEELELVSRMADFLDPNKNALLQKLMYTGLTLEQAKAANMGALMILMFGAIYMSSSSMNKTSSFYADSY